MLFVILDMLSVNSRVQIQNFSFFVLIDWREIYNSNTKLTIFQVLLALWKHECKRVIADRFTMPEDVEWFDQALVKLVEEGLGEDHKNIVDYGVDRYFVDFLRDAPEATGTSAED